MDCRFNDLRRKEVISAADGSRLGYVFGIFGKSEDYIIPWEKIQLIGEDTIIISCKTPKPEKRRRKRLIFKEN